MTVRQYRGLLLGTALPVLLVVAVLVVHGVAARGLADRVTAACAGGGGPTCDELFLQLNGTFDEVARYLGYTSVTCVLIGAAWGAPLVSREIETGTAALAWCQSVTRRRWFTVRVLTCVVALAVLGLLLGLAVTWWSGSFTALQTRGRIVAGVVFVSGPMVPAQWLAAFAVGLLVGTVLHRTLPAAGVTALVTFTGTIAFNVLGSPDARPEIGQVLLQQTEHALPILGVSVVLVVLAGGRLRRLRA